MCVRQKRQRMPFLLLHPRRTMHSRCVCMNKIKNIVAHAVVDGSRCSPSAIPIRTSIASDTHVPPLESINREKALVVLFRQSIVVSTIHVAITKMLRGKRKISTGKFPKQVSITKDNKTTAPKIQTILGNVNLLCVVSRSINGDKGSAVFFEIDMVSKGKNFFC